MKYWIGVAAKAHVMRGVTLGIAQIGHGKRPGLARMSPGDGLVYYSPKLAMQDSAPLQSFTAIGHIVDADIWQADEGDFQPWRRRVQYIQCHDAPIRPLLEVLSFSKGRQSWGYMFRYGLFEVTEEDFRIIATAMEAKL